jgi:O-6-methylguanine DNA methyltransferase
MHFIEEDENLIEVGFGDRTETSSTPLLKEAIRQMDAYFRHALIEFNLPLRTVGTVFQMKVWQALQTIPYGETCSYRDIARIIGNIKAVRAVGGANNKNPVAIIIPCHRVIGKNGKLVGYGGGLDKKAWLLAFEKRTSH